MDSQQQGPHTQSPIDEAVIDAAMLLLRRIVRVLISENPHDSFQAIRQILVERTRQFVGVEFWMKYGGRLKDEIERRIR